MFVCVCVCLFVCVCPQSLRPRLRWSTERGKCVSTVRLSTDSAVRDSSAGGGATRLVRTENSFIEAQQHSVALTNTRHNSEQADPTQHTFSHLCQANLIRCFENATRK